MSETYEFKVAWCKVCDQGWVTIVKDKGKNQFYVQCSECYSEWDHPLHAQLNINLKETVDSSFEEIQEIGWDEYIISDR